MDADQKKLISNINVVKSLSKQLGIPSIKAGRHVIRDDRDWRVNEKEIEYCWLINVSRSFVGWCWLFTVSFNESTFRNTTNPKELIQGIFTIDDKDAIVDFFKLTRNSHFQDQIKASQLNDLFAANRGITLDGVDYEYLIYGHNSEVRISLNNPNSDSWKTWENAVWELGAELAKKSQSTQLAEIFN